MTAITADALGVRPHWLAGGTPSITTGTTDWWMRPGATVVEAPLSAKSAAEHPATDAASQSLVSGRPASMLILYAIQSVQTLVAEGAVDVTHDTLDTLLRMLQKLILPGGPLPQVGASASRGIETHWLVGGTLVSLIVDANGDWLLWGEDRDGNDFLEAEGDWNSNLPLSVALDARETLREMGLAVRVWPDVT